MSELYPRLVGEAWHTLPAPVRALHEGSKRRASGTFTVTNTSSLLGRIIIRCGGLPRAGRQLRLSLVVDADSERETWSRSFGDDAPMVTQQYLVDGVVAERHGPLEVRMRLVVEDGRLRYEGVGVWLCVGRWRLRLPRWMSPRVQASEWAEAGSDAMHTRIALALPLLGPLVEYGGPLLVEATDRDVVDRA